MDAALAEAFRVLRPGGRFLCLEFSKVDCRGSTRSTTPIPSTSSRGSGDG
jgi:demethylmenaquinone methyltransferase/2-methoxy-6-polyprenyl-1,4-benzoquinol methylase